MSSDGDELLEALKQGASTEITVSADKPGHIAVHLTTEDSLEQLTVKQNIEFSINSARESIALLQGLGAQTGNPRFFETIVKLMESIHQANAQLMKIAEDKASGATKPPAPTKDGEQPTVIHNHGGTVVMTTAEKLKQIHDEKDIIDVTPPK